jgi:hypothetical protein
MEFTIDEGEDVPATGLAGISRAAAQRITTDIHCVTGWSKLNTLWKGVSLDTFLNKVSGRAATGPRSGLLLSGRFRLDEAFRIERDTAAQRSGIRLGPGHQEDVLDWTNHALTSNPRDLVIRVERVVSVNIVTCSRPDVRAERRHAPRHRRQQPNTS